MGNYAVLYAILRQLCNSLGLTPIVAALFFLHGCSSEPRVVRIAVAMPLTGPTAQVGNGALRAVELAIAEAEATGAFPYKLEVLALDDRGDGATAVNVANLIVSNPDISVVIGHLHSDTAMKAAPVYAAAGLGLLLPGATHPQLTLQQLSPDWPGPRNVFRMLAHDGLQGRALAELAYGTLGLTQLTILHDATPYGRELSQKVRARFTALGGGVPAFEALPRGTGDIGAWVEKFKGAEGVFFGGIYVEAGLLLKGLRDKGWKGRFLAGDGAKMPELFDVAGEAAEGAYFSTPGLPAHALPDAGRFIEAYQERYPGVPLGVYDHFAYEAAEVALDAILQMRGDRLKVIEALHRTDRYGILGRIRFDTKGDLRERRVSLWKADAESRSYLLMVDHQKRRAPK